MAEVPVEGKGSRAGAFRWLHGPSPLASLLAPVPGAFPDVRALPGALTLKENRFRSVFHVPGAVLSGAGAETGRLDLRDGVVVKVYRYPKAWDRLRYRILRHRAAQEWTALRHLEEAGLPVPRPLALGEDRCGGTVTRAALVISFIPDAVPLATRLEGLVGPGRAEALSFLERTGSLIRRLHRAGVWHRDLHAGNILVSRRDDSLHLIDLHSAVFLPWLPPWLRRRGVARLCASLEGIVPDGGLGALVSASGAGGPGAEDSIRRIARGIERTRIHSRSKRCFVPSTLFDVETRSGERIYHLRSFSLEALAPLMKDAPPGECLKRWPRGWVAAADAAGRRVCVKYRRHSWREVLQALVESHPLRRAYGGGHSLRVRGIETPPVIALRERRFLGMVLEAHLITDLVDGGVPLDRFLLDAYWGKPPARGAAARRKRLLAEEVGAFLRRVHDQGLSPHDFSPQNLLVAREALAAREEDPGCSDPFLSWIDLDHLYLWKPLLERRRRRNLIQIANLPEGHVTTADRLRGLEAYARGERDRLSAALVDALRHGILSEHYRVLERLLVRERTGRRPS
jgi:tRNA A-37 threonylcarbamoyl transferase component Bud32